VEAWWRQLGEVVVEAGSKARRQRHCRGGLALARRLAGSSAAELGVVAGGGAAPCRQRGAAKASEGPAARSRGRAERRVEANSPSGHGGRRWRAAGSAEAS